MWAKIRPWYYVFWCTAYMLFISIGTLVYSTRHEHHQAYYDSLGDGFNTLFVVFTIYFTGVMTAIHVPVILAQLRKKRGGIVWVL
jgi:hypothetical protein